MDVDWIAVALTGLVSMLSWLIYLVASTSLQNQAVGALFLILAVISLIRFGQLLDKSVKGTI